MDTAFTPYDKQSEYSRLFLANIPQSFLLDVAKVIRQATLSAYQRDPELLWGLRRDKYPIDRRSLIENGLYNLAARYANDGMCASERKNAANNCTHVELTCGPVVLIPAAVDSTGEIVRDAVYRRSLALNPQGAFDGMVDVVPAGDALLSVILYGPSSLYPKGTDEAKPTFVVVRFPANDWSCYVEGRVDLLGRLRDHEKEEEAVAPAQVARVKVATVQEVS